MNALWPPLLQWAGRSVAAPCASGKLGRSLCGHGATSGNRWKMSRIDTNLKNPQAGTGIHWDHWVILETLMQDDATKSFPQMMKPQSLQGMDGNGSSLGSSQPHSIKSYAMHQATFSALLHLAKSRENLWPGPRRCCFLKIVKYLQTTNCVSQSKERRIRV